MAEIGLRIFRASRLEALVAPLSELLRETRPAPLLAAQTVIAAHPGMKHWLAGQLARAAGRDGISANLDIVLASTWLERLAQERLGAGAVSLPRYQPRLLRWTLHEMLAPGRLPASVSDPRIAAYLARDDATGTAQESASARRRLQLAERLARLYSQYLVYRPDWLRDWQRGNYRHAVAAGRDLATLEARLLGPLWRELSARLGSHRGEAIAELCAAVVADDTPRPALQVFGISHLAPAELQVLQAYARQALVALYVPDPCREYWGGLGLRAPEQWRAWREEETQRIDAAGDGDYWQDQGHPLLARWGRLGQHFFSALADADARADTRHWQDQQPAPALDRLQRLQESLRRLDPRLLDRVPATAAERDTERADASLRVHACHTRQRELEVLRDALLDALDNGIAPGQMVVMAPDIQAYLPLIAAVFGDAGSARERLLPYHLADVPMARSHPLFALVQRLLELPGQRISAPEVADLLGVAEIRRRLGLDDDAVATLLDWLRQSRVAWALDGAHRAGFGVPAVASHSFAWAMDRLIAGYLMSDAPEADRDRAFVLPDGTELLPVTGSHGPAADALGALDRLLQELQAWCDLAATPRSASAWAHHLELRLDALLRIDHHEAGAREAWDALKRLLRLIETEPAEAGENPLLHYAVVRDLLTQRLTGIPERQRFLMGGITFCGMVPQRAIPFELVAVLGLDDGEFPRRAGNDGLDLMASLRRIGDRDVRSDDRYLFLETLMSARRRLHLSFRGRSVRDGKPRNPAAPLTELLAELDRAGGLAADAGDSARPWLVAHPLQPFDARYFDGGDPRLYSYSARYQAMRGDGRAPVPTFLPGDLADPADGGAAEVPPDPLPLAALAAYYKDPAKNLLATRLKLRLDALDADDALAAVEPLESRVERLATVARRVFLHDVLPAWPEPPWQPAEIPAWVRLSGLLPEGRLGAQAWARELATIHALLDAARAQPSLDGDVAARATSVAIDLDLAGAGPRLRLGGRVDQVLPLSEGRGWQLLRAFPGGSDKKVLKSEEDLHFGERVALFLDWAALRLQSASRASTASLAALRVTLLLAPGDRPWQDSLNAWDQALLRAGLDERASRLADLEARLRLLVQWWQTAPQQPPWYFPRTSAAALRDDGKDVAKRWSDGRDHGERHQDPGYNALLAGDVDFAEDTLQRAQLFAFAQSLERCIRFPVEAAADPVPAA